MMTNKEKEIYKKDKSIHNELLEMYRDYDRWRNPNIPDEYRVHKPSSFNNFKKTNTLEKLIVSFLRHEGWWAERTKNVGTFRDNTFNYEDVCGFKRQAGSKGWTRGSGTKGLSDIKSVIGGRDVSIEVKNLYTKDKIRPDQEDYRNNIELAGGIYVIAQSISGFVEWYRSNFQTNPRQKEFWEMLRNSKGRKKTVW